MSARPTKRMKHADFLALGLLGFGNYLFEKG
jgi:hypothetical protein